VKRNMIKSKVEFKTRRDSKKKIKNLKREGNKYYVEIYILFLHRLSLYI
jgi:hypothetical protein